MDQDESGRLRVKVEITPQPDGTSCGPTCLGAIYRYHGDAIETARLIPEVVALDDGGTLAVFLGQHALARGYRATIYSYNLRVFDPTWFRPGAPPLADRLAKQLEVRTDAKLCVATRGYLDFVRQGGEIRLQDLRFELIYDLLDREIPVICGLSATWLYQSCREYGVAMAADDLRGEPVGHFVIVCGCDRERHTVLIADPYAGNPLSKDPVYEVRFDRFVSAMLIGVLTYDANFLVVEPSEDEESER